MKIEIEVTYKDGYIMNKGCLRTRLTNVFVMAPSHKLKNSPTYAAASIIATFLWKGSIKSFNELLGWMNVVSVTTMAVWMGESFSQCKTQTADYCFHHANE